MLSEAEAIELHALLEEQDFEGRILPAVLTGDATRPGPLYRLQECTKTFDDHWHQKGLPDPYRPLPRLPYFPWLFDLLLNRPRIAVPKSREMMISWAVIGYGVHRCQTQPRTRVIVQTEKEAKGINLIKGSGVPGYARTLYETQSPRLQVQFPLAKPMDEQPSDAISWKNGSVIMAVPAGARQVASYHPTVMVFDEAAHIPEFAEAWSVAEPVCPQIIAVPSVAPGAFWEMARPA